MEKVAACFFLLFVSIVDKYLFVNKARNPMLIRLGLGISLYSLIFYSIFIWKLFFFPNWNVILLTWDFIISSAPDVGYGHREEKRSESAPRVGHFQTQPI